MQDGDESALVVEAEGSADGYDWPQDLGLGGVTSLRHRWVVSVDGHGSALLPAAELAVLRVRLDVQVEAWNSLWGLLESESFRVDLFVAECLGVVARFRSLPDEPDPDFEQAVELIRLGLDPDLLP